ncbi:Spore germination protein B1 [Sporomusa carbonis]|uniref:spore germination protein n=1 Tax=Sporomusa carbonis TaxID=3076075 RepID=UPI003A724BBF
MIYNTEGISRKLQELKALIVGAAEVKQDMEVLVRTLREEYVESEAYQLTTALQVNLEHLREILAGSDDIQFREFWIVPFQLKASIVFLEEMTDQAIINEHVIEKLTNSRSPEAFGSQQFELVDVIRNIILTAASVTKEDKLEPIVNRILLGDAALFIDTINTAIIIASRKVDSRAISEPETEAEIRGPRDGFTEELRVNITLIRRRIKNPNLVVKKQTVGVRSKTEIAIVYFRGIANFKLIHEVKKRLRNITTDIPAPSGIHNLLEDSPFSIFPTVMSTERPDKLIVALAEGKVGVLIDGTPFCYTVPTVFTDFFKSGDDYYEKWMPAALIRLTRYVSAFFALTVPAFYVAVTSFHPALLPTPLVLTIGTSREGVPFPAFIEALIMETLLEIMQEAGIRLPKLIGPAVSIVGGLVIGEAAVRAGLVSASLTIVTSFTAIATFNISSYRMGLPLRLLRVPLMVMAAGFGMFGVMCGLIAIAIHLSILKSFGEPYLAPLAPKSSSNLSDLKDTLAVLPATQMVERPAYVEPQDRKRQKNDE